MKKNGAAHALITPEATGWRLRMGGQDQALASLDDALASIPSHAHIELALPCQAVLMERHTLPSTDRAELADMLNLQMEKTLPFPVDEMSHGFEVLGNSDSETTVLSVAAQHSQLETLCAPLRLNGRVPERISLHALRVAAACPLDETVLAVWPEQGQTVLAIIEKAKLSWAQAVPSADAETVIAELPGLLIAAELEGVPTNFTHVFASPGEPALSSALGTHFGRPIQPLELPPETTNALDLLPPGWLLEANSRESGERMKQRLLAFAVIYLLLIAGAFIFLAVQKRGLQKMQVQLAEMRPRYAGIANQIARWNTLAPVVEPSRFTCEVLHLLARNRNTNVEFTQFILSNREWTLKGEATTDGHFEFTQKLKKDEDLKAFDMPPPNPPYVLIGNTGKVTFTIVGRPPK